MEDPASGVEVAEVERPQPGQGEVLVNITLRPVNPADIFSLQGTQWSRRLGTYALLFIKLSNPGT